MVTTEGYSTARHYSGGSDLVELTIRGSSTVISGIFKQLRVTISLTKSTPQSTNLITSVL